MESSLVYSIASGRVLQDFDVGSRLKYFEKMSFLEMFSVSSSPTRTMGMGAAVGRPYQHWLMM